MSVRACFDAGDAVPPPSREPIGCVAVNLHKILLDPATSALAAERGGLYCVAKYGREWVRTAVCAQPMSRHAKNKTVNANSNVNSSAARGREGREREGREGRDGGRGGGGGGGHSGRYSHRSHRSGGQGRERGGGEGEEDDVYGKFRAENSALDWRSLLSFGLGDSFLFPVLEPASVVTVGVFDASDVCLCTLSVRLSTLHATIDANAGIPSMKEKGKGKGKGKEKGEGEEEGEGKGKGRGKGGAANRLLYPIHIEPKTKGKERREGREGKEGKEGKGGRGGGGGVRYQVGFVDVSFDVRYTSRADLWRRYFSLSHVPPNVFEKPLPMRLHYSLQVRRRGLYI